MNFACISTSIVFDNVSINLLLSLDYVLLGSRLLELEPLFQDLPSYRSPLWASKL